MRISFRLAILFLIAFSFAVPQVPALKMAVGVESAHAQEKKRKTLFDVLFKRRKKKKNVNNRANSRPASGLPGVRLRSGTNKRSNTATASRPAKKRAVAKPAVVAVKNENAAKILVVGDFMASSLAKGLERQYADNPNIVILNRGKANSGIVRDDVQDWPKTIPEFIAEEKPIAVIALVGMNDRQQMRLEAGRVEKLTEEWTKAYNERILKIATSTATAKIPFLWVGLPPVKFGKMNTDYLIFNEMYRSTTASVGGTFVDVWDGFTNAEGKYVSAGPDINGQIVRLRGSKGINMTRAGQLKLAFFADKELRRLGILSNAGNAAFAALGTINLSVAQPGVPDYDPASTGKTVVLSLGSPALDGGDILEGEADFLKADGSTDSVSHDLVAAGKLRQPHVGRIDSDWGIPEVKEEPAKDKKEAKTDGTKKPVAETATQ